MKSAGKYGTVSFFLFVAVLTLSQVNGFTASAIEPITSPITSSITPTPTDTPPVTSPITPTQTPTPTSSSGSSGTGNSGSGNSAGGEGNNGGGSSGSAPSCGDQKPGSAPYITSIRRTGTNQLTLTWTRAADPVSYYWVAYGTKPGSLEYGSGAIGNRNTVSFQVNALSAGRMYFFRVRAGNGCKPGEYSNEIGANTSGRIFTGPAAGFRQGVLGTATKGNTTIVRPTETNMVTPNPTRVSSNQPTNNQSWFSQVISFFGNLFGK